MIKVIRILIVLTAAAIISVPLKAQDRKISQFKHLKKPKISVVKFQKMLVVEAEGDPNVIGQRVYRLLYQLYFQIPEVQNDPERPALRVRWLESQDIEKSEWIGMYALPIPETETVLPHYEAQEDLEVYLTTWAYGAVAEILHAGPSDKEESSIKKLLDFMQKEGYEIMGDLEEEYIEGPSMRGWGDPEKHVKIIRYQVKKILQD
jgi:hypothetical protein